MIAPLPRRTLRARVGAPLAIALVYAVFALPAAPAAPTAYIGLPIELALLVLAVLIMPAPLARATRLGATLAVGLLLLFKLVDLATRLAIGRSFNPALDAALPGFGWNVLSRALGPGVAALLLAAIALLFFGLLWLIAAGLRGLQDWPRPRRRAAAIASAGLAVAGALLLLAPAAARPPLVGIDNSRLLLARVTETQRALRDLAVFRARLARGSATADDGADFGPLAGKDVLFVFVESYGRTVLERPRYADTIGPRLAAFERRLADAGFGARSGWLTSPTVGGQSWLAHGTLFSGLWVDNQARYEQLVASERVSLNRRFRAAGWRTVAVMPAITRAWPEGEWFGYDRVYGVDDLGYEGRPFNWVTMPDQYTLAALQRRELARGDDDPVMAEVALISSHAPWTPIPPLLDWSAVGDGRVFDAYADAGDPPSVVWQDNERVRAQYRKAIDYALATLASFVETYGHEDLVLVILGDHQPAPLVTGDAATRDVPVHLIAADADVLSAIDGWQWARGMRPGATTPVWRMDAFRNRFLDAFESGDRTGR